MDVTHLPPYERNVNTVFQNYALFPHYNLFDNVAYGLRVRKRPASEIADRVEQALSTVGLSGYGIALAGQEGYPAAAPGAPGDFLSFLASLG